MAEEKDYIGHRQRLKERFLRGHGQDMADYEMLELLLTLAIPRKDTKPLAKALINEFGSFAGVMGADENALMCFSGLKENSVLIFSIVKEAALRMTWQNLCADDKMVISNWDAMIDYCRMKMAHKTKEEFMLIFLDAKLKVIGQDVQQRGTTDNVAIHPAEVVKSRFMKLDSSHVQYVMDCMRDNTTYVRNIKKYLLAALYNAPVTIGNYYSSLVQHDMYGDGQRGRG